MQLLVVAIYSCALLWAQTVCDSGTEKSKRDVAENNYGDNSHQQSQPTKAYQQSSSQGLTYRGKDAATTPNSGSAQDDSRRTLETQEPQVASQVPPSGSNFQANQQFSNSQRHAPITLHSQYAQMLAGTPQLSFSTGLSSAPYNLNFLSAPLVSQHNELFAETQNPFVVNQPLVQSFAGQHDLTALTQAPPAAYTGLYSATQSLFNTGLDSGIAKYLQPDIKITPQSANPTPQIQLPEQQFKTTPLINSHIYHPRVTTFNAPRPNIFPSEQSLAHKQYNVQPNRENILPNQRSFIHNQQKEHANQQSALAKQQNTYPYPRRLTYKPPNPSQQHNVLPEQKTVVTNQYNPLTEQQNVPPNQQNVLTRQQNTPPNRYYIRRRPQHLHPNQRDTPHNQPDTLHKQQNVYNNQQNLQSNQQNIQPQQKNPVARHRNVPHIQQLSPPTPPRFYTNFKPMIPKDIPVREPVIQEEVNQEKETDDDKPRVQEETENKKEEKSEDDDDNSNYKEEEDVNSEEEEEEEDEEPVKPRFSGKYNKSDDNDDDDNESYKRKEDDEDEEESEESKDSSRYSESRPEYSKLFSKHRYPKEYSFVPSYLKHHHSSADCNNKDAFKFTHDDGNPDVEVKMFKYTKSVNQPDINESIEGKESETIPVIHHRKKSYKEHWVITKSSKSMK